MRELAASHDGGAVDLSIGSPSDPPPASIIRALSESNAERGYPPSIGTPEFREAAATWLNSVAGTSIEAADVAATVGSKEVVAGMPHWLKLRRPDLDTILFPAISYPSYEMGADLANCRAVPVPVDDQWRINLDAIDPADAARALCLWVNTPGNPAGGIDDLEAAAAWGRANGVPVLSDECYIEFTWQGKPRSILEHGNDGVLAVHSLSKRSNLAGARAGFFAGDADLVYYLSEVRKHSGMIPAGPVQSASVVAFQDQTHVDDQRELYRRRLTRMIDILANIGVEAPMPGGGFYLWAPAPNGDAWALTERLARDGGAVVSPGEFYGVQGAGHVRIAVVQSDAALDLVAERLAATQRSSVRGLRSGAEQRLA